MTSPAAAAVDVRSAIPSVETYSADNNGTATDADSDAATTGYTGMTTALLKNIDAGLSPTLTVGATIDADTYCVQSAVGGFTYRYGLGNAAPFTNGVVAAGTCP